MRHLWSNSRRHQARGLLSEQATIVDGGGDAGMSTIETSLGVSRRTFLVASLLGGGTLMIGFSLGSRAQAPSPPPTPNAFIRIDAQGRVTLFMPYVEMGQGAYTSQAQIVAEELEIDPATMILEPAPANEKLYASPLIGGQITGGSLSLR